MNVLHVPFHYYPDAVGGTEVYVSALARELRARGIGVAIAAPDHASRQYAHDGFDVHRFATTAAPSDVSALYGTGDPLAAAGFERILDRVEPALVHLHAMSPAVSVQVVEAVKARGIPVVFTCHIPGILCPRGTLLRHGSTVCDGVWTLSGCTTCVLQDKGLPVPLARFVDRLPTAIGAGVSRLHLRGRASTALRMRGLQAERQQALQRFLRLVDRIVAVSGWLRDVIVRNGVDPAKVVVCRHGMTQRDRAAAVDSPRQPGNPLRLAFLGRLNPVKGAHVLVEAFARRPDLNATLDLFVIVQDDDEYVRQLKERVARDARIRVLAALENDDVVEKLREYDALAVPSQWMETGPLVVYDAFAAGIPVVGSRRGGLLELVGHDIDGLLVEAANVEAWAETLSRLANDPTIGARLRQNVQTPRSMGDAAREMLALYESLAPMDHRAYGT